jgi:hypothetical protein
LLLIKNAYLGTLIGPVSLAEGPFHALGTKSLSVDKIGTKACPNTILTANNTNSDNNTIVVIHSEYFHILKQFNIVHCFSYTTPIYYMRAKLFIIM